MNSPATPLEGKVVIRPIAFKPVVPQILPHGSQERSPLGISTGTGNPTSTCSNGGVYPPLLGRPDPRYTSTPTLSRSHIQHYGSMGDLKTLGQSSSYSLDRRNISIPMNSRGYYEPFTDKNACNSNNKFNNYTKLHNAKNIQLTKTISSHKIGMINNSPVPNSSNIAYPASSKSSTENSSNASNSPSTYPLPPPRPPSLQSTCSNTEDSHHRFSSFDNCISLTYDHSTPSFDNSTHSTHSFSRATPGHEHLPSHKYHPGVGGGGGNDLPRYESLRNLSSTETHGNYSSSAGHHGRHHHLRMSGSITNLTRLHHSGLMSGSNLGLDRSLSVTGSNLGLDRSVSGSNLGLDRSGSMRGSLSELRLDDHHQTPSPSDSGVAELEQMLKEKDSEISNLRETMEQNEQVVFKVYEEKEKTWERELKKIRDMYDCRLKAAQQKALKVEQSLTTQTYQLQQERRKLSAELEEAKRERDSGIKQIEQLRKEVSSLRAQLEETEWGLCQKSGEISLLKTQLKDSQGDQTTRGHELLHLRAQVRQYQQEIERRRAEITSMHDLTAQLRRENADLHSQLDQTHQAHSHDQEKSEQAEKSRTEIDTLKRERETQRKKFEEERLRWVEEKERVIRYQKQLHHNYVSMLTRNRQLEEEVARLTGVPLPPLTTSGGYTGPPSQPLYSINNSNVPNGLPLLSSVSGPVPSIQIYSDVRESGPVSISSESRC